MGYRNFEEMMDALKSSKEKTTCAVVGADGENPMKAALRAYREGIIEPLLIGDDAAIGKCLEKIGGSGEPFRVITARTQGEAAQMAVSLVKAGEAEILMKGNIETSAFFAPLINRKSGLQPKKILSGFAIYEIPTYHKLLAGTDGGITLYPNLEQKKLLIENAVEVLRRLGIAHPKVAVLAPLETATPKIPETMDAAALQKMNERGEIKNCIVAGPISYDLAIKKGSAEMKGYTHPVAGDADLVLFPDITSGNLVTKSWLHSGGTKHAGLAIGGESPVIFGSRSSTAEDKYRSVVIANAIRRKG